MFDYWHLSEGPCYKVGEDRVKLAGGKEIEATDEDLVSLDLSGTSLPEGHALRSGLFPEDALLYLGIQGALEVVSHKEITGEAYAFAAEHDIPGEAVAKVLHLYQLYELS